MRCLLFGDSHLGALRLGNNELEIEKQIPEAIDLAIRPLGGGHLIPTPFLKDKGDYAEICNPQYKKRYKRFPLESQDKIIYGIVSPLHSARLYRHDDFSKYSPYKTLMDEAPISNALLKQAVIFDIRYLLQLIDILQRTQQEVFAIEAPKPFRHNPCLAKIRPEVVGYVDKFFREYVVSELKKRSVPIVFLDENWYDSEGFMLDEFRHENSTDAHHGSTRYGKLMMQRIYAFLQNNYINQ